MEERSPIDDARIGADVDGLEAVVVGGLALDGGAGDGELGIDVASG